MNTYKHIINQCIQTIKNHQSADGGFPHHSIPFNNKEYKTNFIPGLILRTLCLTEVKLATAHHIEIKTIRDNIGDFLLKEKSERWTWNYLSKQSRLEFPEFVFPDDLDDTAICLSSIYLWNKNELNSEAYSHITRTFINNEEKIGGPYFTWITNFSTNPKWKDVDIAVNANIAYFFHLQDIKLPALQEHLTEHMDFDSSPYYPSRIPLSYYLSLTQSRTPINAPKQGSLMENALALCTAFRTNAPHQTIHMLVKHIIDLYEASGFTSEPFCIDPCFDGITYECGSTALTACFVLEALSLYEHNQQQKKGDRFSHIITEIKQIIPLNLIQKAIGKRKEQIMYEPALFAEALQIPKMTVNALVRANLLGWIGYYITDNILDEQKNTQDISLVHICLRKMYFIYHNLITKEQLRFCRRVLDKMDYSHYTKNVSTDTSMGHALPFITALFLKGCSPYSPEVSHMLSFWRCFLSAQQLSDDAHDWKQDIEKGNTNEVLPMIQKHTDNTKEYEHVFWNEVFNEVVTEIHQRLDNAQKAIDHIESKINTKLFSNMITKARDATQKAIIEKEEIESFVHHYNSPQIPVSLEYMDRVNTVQR